MFLICSRGLLQLVDAAKAWAVMGLVSLRRLVMFASNLRAAVLLLAIAAILPASAMGAREQVRSVRPGSIVYRSDLDRWHNKIDDMIAIYGWACIPIPGDKYPCPIVKKVEGFLRTLPQVQPALLRALTRMGADCVMEKRMLRCTYDRYVDRIEQRAYPAKPALISRDLFHLGISVEVEGLSLKYRIDYDRKSAAPGISIIPRNQIRSDPWMNGQETR